MQLRYRRLVHTLGLCIQRGATKRGNYLRKHHVFKSRGKNVSYMLRKVPLYPELISIGNNVNISNNVSLITHDAYNQLPIAKKKMPEKVGELKIEAAWTSFKVERDATGA